MSIALPYIIGFTLGLRKLGKFLLGQWPVLVFSGMLILAMLYVSLRSHQVATVSQITTSTKGTMLAVPQSIKYQSLPIEQTIEKECYKNGQIPTKVIYNMIDFAGTIRTKYPATEVGLGLTLIKLATAREAMHNRAMTASQLEKDTLMNVTASIRYLSQMVSLFDGDLRYGILAYYQGPGTLHKEIKNNTVSYALADRMLTERVLIAKKASTYVAKTAKKPAVIVPIQTHKFEAFDEIQKPEPTPPEPDMTIMAMVPLTPTFMSPKDDSISVNHRLDTITLTPVKVEVDTISKDVNDITNSAIAY